ncbi:MAG: serine/threonine protein kinase [Deltaproteobacteria bacterium]|nr:serine/threonine protein kinase [Deltaproteobacteria bacterium]
MLIAAGTILEGKYRVERLLGAGGMGSVWIAEHTLLHRPVAVKVLDKSASSRDASAVQRFLREAQTAARLRSDHIVDVLDVGRFDDGTPFLIMELLEGEALSSRIRRVTRLSQGEAAQLVDHLLAGLSAAHNAGVIHRDIKPDNCFITQKNGRDHLKLLDFGISKVAPTSPEAPEMRMTRTGVVMGTPYYMAPEQARGAKDIDHRCDLYAAGAILYECVTGRVPFDAESVNELLFKIVLEPLVPPRELAPELEPAFERVVLQAMAREAPARFQTAEEFRAALAPFVGRVSGGTVVVFSNPPPRSGEPAQPVSGVDRTAPVDSDAIRAAIAAPRPSALTPSGLQGLSATGPLHLSEPPPARRGLRLAAIGLVSVLGLGGALAYVSGTRSGTTSSANEASASAPPSASGTDDDDPAASAEPAAKASVAPIVQATVAPVAPPTTSAAPSGAAKPTKGGKKAPAAATTTPPPIVIVPPPPPPPATTTKSGSPRPIDTAL